MARNLTSSEKSTPTRKPFPWERYNQTRIDNEYRKKTFLVFPEWQRSSHGEDLFDKTNKYMLTDMQRMEAYLADDVDENDEANILGDTYERFTDGNKPLLVKDKYGERYLRDLSNREDEDIHIKNLGSSFIENKEAGMPYKPPKTERRILKKMGKRRKPITDKMAKVLSMRAEGYTLKEIADNMGISIRAVRNIRQRMLDREMLVP